MPVIGAILGAIMSGLFLWLIWGNGLEVLNQWIDGRAQRAKEAKDAEAIREARNKAARAPLRAIEDPREAALVLMVRLAQARGDVTPEQRAVITRLSGEKLGLVDKIDNRIALAEFAAKQAPSADEVVGDLTPLLHLSLTDEEKADLVRMMEDVADVHGGATAAQEAMIARLVTRLGYKPQV